jgi:hypothetical protein
MAKGKVGRPAKLTDLELRMKKLEELDIPIAIQNALIDNERAIIEFIWEQMDEGISGTGEPITLDGYPEYYPGYAAFKRRMTGQRTDIINLHLYGDFYASMYTVVTSKGDSFRVEATVPYYDDIIARTGGEVMQLTPGNMESFVDLFITPVIEEVVRQSLNP